jgi:hypothetical protein
MQNEFLSHHTQRLCYPLQFLLPGQLQFLSLDPLQNDFSIPKIKKKKPLNHTARKTSNYNIVRLNKA